MTLTGNAKIGLENALRAIVCGMAREQRLTAKDNDAALRAMAIDLGKSHQREKALIAELADSQRTIGQLEADLAYERDRSFLMTGTEAGNA